MKPEAPTIEICPGITRRTVAHGNAMYQMLATLAAGSQMPAHSHPQEQIVHILEGKMRLIVEGVPHELQRATHFFLRAISRMASRHCQQHACSIRSVRRGTITWRSTKTLVTAPCSCVVQNKAAKSKHGRSTFRLVCDPQYNFSACVMRRGLLLRLDRIIQRQNLRNNWLDFSCINQLGNLSEIGRIRVNGDTRAANSVFLKLDRIGTRYQ